MRTFLLWSWALNLLLFIGIFLTVTNLGTKVGLFAVAWVALNTALQLRCGTILRRR